LAETLRKKATLSPDLTNENQALHFLDRIELIGAKASGLLLITQGVWTDIAMTLPTVGLRTGLKQSSRILWSEASSQASLREGGIGRQASNAR
jgi:hypothetical protein